MRIVSAIVGCAALVAGCTVGPDFRRPDPPAAATYTPGPPPAAPGMPALVVTRDIPAEWWVVFRSPALDALVRRALGGNPSLAEAKARLTQAQALRTARAGAVTWPRVDLTAGAERQRVEVLRQQAKALGIPNAEQMTRGELEVLTGEAANRRKSDAEFKDFQQREAELRAKNSALDENIIIELLIMRLTNE